MIGKQLYQPPIQLIILAYENAIDNTIDNPYLTDRQEYENRNYQYLFIECRLPRIPNIKINA